jgi:hypothetical protein
MPQLSSDHPLLQMSLPRSPSNLYQWLQEWKSATTNTHLHALLHSGYSPNVSMENNSNREQERLCFYLGIADGFGLEFVEFQLQDDESEMRRSTAWVRKGLAEKAFSVLVRHVFKNTAESRHPPSWLPLLQRSKSRQAILTFLRVDPATKSIINLPEVPADPRDERMKTRVRELGILRQFILDLSSRVFCPHLGWYTWDRRGVEADQLQLIELMVRMGEAKRLTDRNTYPFSDDCWEILEALAWEPVAVEARAHCPEPVSPKTIEEAAALGSEAAQVLILRRGFKQYDDKQTKIKAAHDQREEAESRLRRLHA